MMPWVEWVEWVECNQMTSNNNIKNNNYSGIDIAAGGAGIIRNNSLINNLYGIRSCEDSCPEINRNNISDNNTGIYRRSRLFVGKLFFF